MSILVLLNQMKKLYRFIFLSYLPSFIITFFIAVFVFLMIFIFVYIDEFVGKNLGAFTLSKLFFYFSLNTIPRALPLAILLSSIMAIGNMSEHFEVTAMKSAGISFYKITRPLLVFSVLMALFLFSFSNFMLPFINLKMETLLTGIRSSKPALMFKEGSFNNDLRGYSIRIGKIAKDGESFSDILIYDHSEGQGNTTVLAAKSGNFSKIGENGVLLFSLKDGYSYKEVTDSDGVVENNDLIRDHFQERTIRYDLSDFGLKSANKSSFKNDYSMLSLWQINTFIDSLAIYNKGLRGELHKESVKNTVEINEDIILKYTIEWHSRIAIAFSCLLLFLIGAPMGYIIKKGGLGMPIVVSVVLYIVYHTLTITGEKLAEDGTLEPWEGVWMATMIILPVGLLLFYKSARDRTEWKLPTFVKSK
jgi:lipopolysaccharide export system permease protein